MQSAETLVDLNAIAGERPARSVPIEREEPLDVPGNLVLAGLAPRDRALLGPHLERVMLAREQVLTAPGDIVPYVFFPEGATAVSMFTVLDSDRMAETALVGRQGGVGLVAAAGDGRGLGRAVVIIPGPALRLPVTLLMNAARRSAGLRTALARQSELLVGQAMQMAACNAVHSVERRICRWILALHDCVREGAIAGSANAAPLPLTQELLGDALGVQRTTVTVVAMRLQQAGLVRYGRGRIFVLDRAGLESAACECHGAMQRLRQRLGVAPAAET